MFLGFRVRVSETKNDTSSTYYFAYRFFSRLTRRISLYSRINSSSDAPQEAIIASSSFAAARMASILAFRVSRWAGMKNPNFSPWRMMANGRPPSRYPARFSRNSRRPSRFPCCVLYVHMPTPAALGGASLGPLGMDCCMPSRLAASYAEARGSFRRSSTTWTGMPRCAWPGFRIAGAQRAYNRD